MNVRKLIAGSTIVVALLAAGCQPHGAGWHPTKKDVATCQEDEACWNCRTMGNRICGPVAP